MIILDERDEAKVVDLDYEQLMRFHVHQCHASIQTNL